MISTQRRLAIVALTALAACSGGGTRDVAPQNLLYSDGLPMLMVGVPSDVDVPVWTGDPVQFSIAPALPGGLSIDASTGVISGTPTEAAARRTYTVTAANNGGSASAEVVLTVVTPPRFAYTVSSEDSTIAAFTIDAPTGQMRAQGYILTPPFELGPERLVAHTSGRFAYVPNSATSNVSVYSIDADDGWLTPGTPASVGAGPHDMAIDPNGLFAWVTSRGSNQVQAFAIHPQTGELNPVGAPLATGVEPSAIAVEPTGRFAFVTLHGDSDSGAGSAVQAYSIHPGTGALTAVGPELSLNGTKPVGISVSAITDTLCVILEGLDLVIPIHYDPVLGGLTALLPDATGALPASVSVDPTGRFAYVANASDGSISSYLVDAGTGELSPIGTVAAGSTPAAIAVHPNGKFVYAVNFGSNDVQLYSADHATGALTLVEDVVTRTFPSGITLVQGAHPVTWVPRFVHVASAEANEISTYTIDSSNGALTEVGLAPLTEMGPTSIAVDPRQRFVYVANGDSHSISAYLLNPATGVLTVIAFPKTVTGTPTHLMVDPSGRFLYMSSRDVLAPDDGFVTTFAIDPGDGSLSMLDSHATGHNAMWVACNPTGQYLYVANIGDGMGTGTISVLRISAVDGTLSFSAAATPAPGVGALGFHPRGRVLYAVLVNADATVQFAMDPANGKLTLIPGTADGGLRPTAIAVNPNGTGAYVSSFNPLGNGHVAYFPIDAGFRLVEPALITEDGMHPVDLAIDPTGRFLYVANSASNDVSVMRVDPLTGELTIATPVVCGLSPSALVVTSVVH